MDNEQLAELTKYLFSIANGKKPKNDVIGLCWNANDFIGSGEPDVYELFEEIWQCAPLDYSSKEECGEGRWEGQRGNDRRTLAGLTAAFIETEYLNRNQQ